MIYNYNKNGKGELTFLNHFIYSGNWKNDLKNGKGQYEYSNESIFEGEWENNEIINVIFILVTMIMKLYKIKRKFGTYIY